MSQDSGFYQAILLVSIGSRPDGNHGGVVLEWPITPKHTRKAAGDVTCLY
jgi:hypothetical protein